MRKGDSLLFFFVFPPSLFWPRPATHIVMVKRGRERIFFPFSLVGKEKRGVDMDSGSLEEKGAFRGWGEGLFSGNGVKIGK